jgi:hypothetical protein
MVSCTRFLLALILAAAWGHAMAAWVKVAESSGSTVYLDPAVSKKVGDNIMVWLLRDHHEMRFGTGGPYLVVARPGGGRLPRRAGCGASMRPTTPSRWAKGKFVASEHGPMSWNDAQPRSIMGRVVELACPKS